MHYSLSFAIDNNNYGSAAWCKVDLAFLHVDACRLMFHRVDYHVLLPNNGAILACAHMYLGTVVFPFKCQFQIELYISFQTRVLFLQ